MHLERLTCVIEANLKKYPPSASHHPHASPLSPPTPVNDSFFLSVLCSASPTHPALYHHSVWSCGMDKWSPAAGPDF